MSSGARLAVAAVVGMLSWVVYYRVNVGPWCPAMWFGTAPPLVMLLSGQLAYRLLGLVRPR
jgi:hypothetical protein